MKIIKKYPTGLEIEIDTSDWIPDENEITKKEISKNEKQEAYYQYGKANNEYSKSLWDWIDKLCSNEDQRTEARIQLEISYTKAMIKAYEMGLAKYPFDNVNNIFIDPWDLE